jgi:hypothetical protein
MFLLRVAATICLLGVPGIALSAGERRCGWLQNPTPGNWWLVDQNATWILMRQGGAEPRGFTLIPDISRHHYVRTNGNYGYTCACIGGEFNKAQSRLTLVRSFEQRPLSACRKDPALPRP